MQCAVFSLISLKKASAFTEEPGERDPSPLQKNTHKHKTTLHWDKFIQWWTDTIKAMASRVCRALFKLLHKGQRSVENKWKHRLRKLINGESLGGLLELLQRGAGLVAPCLCRAEHSLAARLREHLSIWHCLIRASLCGTVEDKILVSP